MSCLPNRCVKNTRNKCVDVIVHPPCMHKCLCNHTTQSHMDELQLEVTILNDEMSMILNEADYMKARSM
jgi:hypothetical protein